MEYPFNITLEKPAILLVSGFATLERIPPIVSDFQLDAYIVVNGNICSRDYDYLSEAGSITLKVAPSCTLLLLPGDNQVSFHRYDQGGNGNGARSEVTVLAIAARVGTD